MSEIRDFCKLSDEELKARRAQLRKELFPLARGREELPDGLALLFDAKPEISQALEDFVTFERECCPGLDFSLHDTSGPLRLEIRGIDPKASIFAGIAESDAESDTESDTESDSPSQQALAPSDPEGRGWLKLLRSTGLGAIGAFTLFCLVPMALVAVLGAVLASSLAGLENPWTLGTGTLLFAWLFWRWERRRAAGSRARKSGTGQESCGC